MRAFLLLFVSLFGFPLTSTAESKILVVGDSISAGYGLSQGKSWVDLLNNRLLAQNSSYRAVNASISGDTTSGGKSRLNQALQTHRPQIVVIELGGNDGLRGLSLDDMKKNLAEMIRLSQQQNAKVLLVGMELPPNYGPLFTRRFQKIYSDLSSEHKVPLVPFILKGLEDRRDLFQADQIHPKEEAQPVLLDNVWTKLKTIL